MFKDRVYKGITKTPSAKHGCHRLQVKGYVWCVQDTLAMTIPLTTSSLYPWGSYWMWEPTACSNSPMGGMLYPWESIYRFGDGVFFCVYSSSIFRNIPQDPFIYTAALSWLIWGICGEVHWFCFHTRKHFQKCHSHVQERWFDSGELAVGSSICQNPCSTGVIQMLAVFATIIVGIICLHAHLSLATRTCCQNTVWYTEMAAGDASHH